MKIHSDFYLNGIKAEAIKQIINPAKEITVNRIDHVFNVSFSVKPLSR